jgi:hypothetical protein
MKMANRHGADLSSHISDKAWQRKRGSISPAHEQALQHHTIEWAPSPPDQKPVELHPFHSYNYQDSKSKEQSKESIYKLQTSPQEKLPQTLPKITVSCKGFNPVKIDRQHSQHDGCNATLIATLQRTTAGNSITFWNLEVLWKIFFFKLWTYLHKKLQVHILTLWCSAFGLLVATACLQVDTLYIQNPCKSCRSAKSKSHAVVRTWNYIGFQNKRTKI